MLRRITAAAARGRQAIDRSGLPEPGAVALTEVPVPPLPGLLQPPQVLRTELDREPLDIIGVVTPATHRHLSERLGAAELATTERHRAMIAGRGQGGMRPGHAVWGWSCRSGLRARTGLDWALSAPGLTGPAAAEGAGAHTWSRCCARSASASRRAVHLSFASCWWPRHARSRVYTSWLPPPDRDYLPAGPEDSDPAAAPRIAPRPRVAAGHTGGRQGAGQARSSAGSSENSAIISSA